MAAVYALVAAGWSVDRATGNIRYIGDAHGGANPSYATGIELHRWLSDLSDDAVSVGDDLLDRTDPVASKRSTDFIMRLKGIYNIDATASEHLYDCSITQGSAGVDQIIYDGITVFGNTANIQVIQSGAAVANDFWNSNGGLNPDAVKGISHRFLIKVHDFAGNGGDIDGRRLIGTCRNWGKTWKEFLIAGTERGKNTLALDEQPDLNNTSDIAVIAALADISNQSLGYNGIDADGDSVDEFYYSSWTKGANTINDLYEFTKYVVSTGSTATLYGLPAAVFRGPTHQVNYISEVNGPFLESVAVTFGNGATAQVLALKDDGTTGTLWVQLLTGTAPADTDTITQAAVTAAVSGAPVTLSVSTPFIGVSTGAAVIGAFGIGISDVLTINDSLTDLSGTAISPPNVVGFSVSNLVSGQGSVTVYPWDGTTLDSEGNPAVDKTQMSISTALTGVAETAVVVVDAIPANTPDSGSLRIISDAGQALLVSYTSYTGSTFTIASTDFSAANVAAGNGAMVAYLDNVPAATTETFSYTYSAAAKVVVEVRDPVGLIEPFITSATLGDTTQTINTIRSSDA